ncbi:SnoaL-like domain-containing protein [Muriicola jejuensis]|uniref:SnoaL-like domain-containing protein n=1 Tax=Muriicola jejuensis TaxID=504488 RepID=A0A6P0UI44_9FLAO|nr:nuclear transport factor 2 family protein [Muriicola jejuensis]NER10793.1 hypothetical protein [Muriicola jejuensis]SMP16245.1 SnoaL-like domain-containing protein [Muriicola jejuensis]
METIEHVITLEKEALNQWSKANPLGYGIHAHKDQIYFDNLGAQDQIEGKEKIGEYVKETFAQLQPHNYELVGLKARQYGDVVILSYRYHPTMPDGSPSAQWAATVVYALIDSKWQLVHASWVMLKPPGMG